MQIQTSLQEDPNVQKLQEEMEQKQHQLEESQVVMKTLPISQMLTKINELKEIQNKIEDLKKEEQSLIERNQPWQDEALQLSQAVDDKLQQLRQRETELAKKVAEHVTESLLEEVHNEEKQLVYIMQLNNTYKNIADKIRGKAAK